MRHFISIIILLTTSFIYGQADPVFSNVNLGMSVDEVKKRETSKLVKVDDEYTFFTALHYKTRLMGQDSRLAYYFSNQKLSNVKYLIQNNHTDFPDYYDDFSYFHDFLVRKFGEPFGGGVDWNWEDDRYKSDSTLYIQALKEGHLELIQAWTVEKTAIILSLSGKDSDAVGLTIEFGRLKGQR